MANKSTPARKSIKKRTQNWKPMKFDCKKLGLGEKIERKMIRILQSN